MLLSCLYGAGEVSRAVVLSTDLTSHLDPVSAALGQVRLTVCAQLVLTPGMRARLACAGHASRIWAAFAASVRVLRSGACALAWNVCALVIMYSSAVPGLVLLALARLAAGQGV